MGAPAGILSDPAAHRLAFGDYEALFLPGRGMLGASLRHAGDELLRRIDDLDGAAAKGSTAGIPLLHPWANRLAAPRYTVAGRSVELDPKSPLLHLDEHGLPIHGVPWALLAWTVDQATGTMLRAHLDWDRDDLLAVFPFRHRLEMRAALSTCGLTIETTLHAGGHADAGAPVSFGFHPYLGIPNLARRDWRLILPPMRRLALDANGIPTGADEPFAGFDDALGARAFDDGFALPGDATVFALVGAGRRISIELVEGFRYAQIFAPRDKELVALEPMTAPANALASGSGLTLVSPGGRLRTSFRIAVASA